MSTYCSINGQLLPERDASLKINDLSIRRGFGIFDFFRVSNGYPLYLERHIRRIIKGASDAGLHWPVTHESLEENIRQVIQANEVYPAGAIRLVLTGGYSSWEPAAPNLIITYEPLHGFDEVLYSHGAAVISHDFLRELSHIKTISYMTAISLIPKMRAAGAVEILYHRNQEVSEFSRSNLFLVKNGRLITTGKNILPGITRSVIMDLAKTEVERVTLEDVMEADELFMTSTIKRIIPVVTVDGRKIAAGTPGEVTKQLMEELRKRDVEEVAMRIGNHI